MPVCECVCVCVCVVFICMCTCVCGIGGGGGGENGGGGGGSGGGGGNGNCSVTHLFPFDELVPILKLLRHGDVLQFQHMHAGLSARHGSRHGLDARVPRWALGGGDQAPLKVTLHLPVSRLRGH